MNRKATFAKRQRETDLKDRARQKEARKAARKAAPRTSKGPEIAWDEAVYANTTDDDDAVIATADDSTTGDTPAQDDLAADATPAAPATDDYSV